MPQLKYIGPGPQVGVVPLPEGWSAADHDEPDSDLAELKVASGNYELVSPPARTRTRSAASDNNNNDDEED